MVALRSKKAVTNTMCEILLEIVTAGCSFILPRLLLSHFGSQYNGITSSITQFISCVSLLKSGIGSVTRAALYKPLAENNVKGISEVVNATSGFMRKIAVFFSVAVLGFASVYSFLVSKSFEWCFTFTLVLILSISTFAQYFFGLTYQMVLQADQKNYIISIITIISTIMNTLVASMLILMGFGIHVVKLGSAVVFCLPPIFYNVWVKSKYKIDRKVKPNYDLISERWDAFGHQLANFVNTNTDIMVATIFLNLYEVSVYTIYSMVGNAIKKAITAIGSGTTAAFGNMMARNEQKILKERFNQFEITIYWTTTLLLTVTAVMFIPFVEIYTKGISDANYSRPLFGYLICLSIYFSCIKIPYEQIIFAAGHFKKTRNGAFLEAGINIGLSLILVNVLGLNGIIIGTIIATTYRTIRYHLYICDNIIERKKNGIIIKILYSIVSMLICLAIAYFLPLAGIHNYLLWLFWACVVFAIAAIICSLLGYLLFGKEMKSVIDFIIRVFKRMKNSENES